MPAVPANAHAPTRAAREELSRLPGRVSVFTSLLAAGSLWLGERHVLQVRTGPVRDEYRRFNLREIQALQLRQTSRGVVYNVILGLGLGLFGLIAVFAGSPGGRILTGLLAVGFLVLLVVNMLRGPTVRCQLRTALGVYPLPSLSRLGPARRAFERIRERVEAVQGTLGDGALATELQRAFAAQSQNVYTQAATGVVRPPNS